MDQIIMQNPTCPIESIITIEAWLNDDSLRYIRTDNRLFKNVLEVNPIWCSGYMKFYDYYFNDIESFNIINDLLNYQFDYNKDNIKNFCNTLYNILDRKIPKLNTIIIQSPPSAGKKFFFAGIINFFLIRDKWEIQIEVHFNVIKRNV